MEEKMISLFNVILKKRLKNKLEVHDKMTITKQNFFFWYNFLLLELNMFLFPIKLETSNLSPYLIS